MRDVAIVTIRNSSTRLPNKAIMKIKGDIRSIDIVIQRAKQTGFPVILATSTHESDDEFEEIAKQYKIHLFRGSLLNKIKRWYDCFVQFDIQNALLLDGDDLCHDFNLGKKSLVLLKEKKIHMVINPPDIVTGLFTCAINKEGISRLYNLVQSDGCDTDVITKFVENAELKTEFIELNNFQRKKNIRLTLDYPEDLEFFRELYDKVHILEDTTKVVEFLTTNKNLTEINYHREKDFLENQKKFNESLNL